MDRETVVVVAVVIVGYTLYGGLAVGAAVATDAFGDTAVDAGPASTPADGEGETRLTFDEVAADAGLEYDGRQWGTGTQSVASDSGVYAADYDRDGWTDLLALGGDRPVLFENRGGEFQPSGALPEFDRHVRTALFVDADIDGEEELVVFSLGEPPQLLEYRDGEFVAVEAGFETELAVPIGAAAGDYDGDGCPDLFVVQNGNWADRHPAGEGEYDLADGQDNGNENQLYRGDCEGGFEPTTEAAGIRGQRWSLATSMVDLTGNGHQDIYVANDFNRDVLYVNQGDGSFTRRVLGDRTNRNGMSAEVGDVNGDGRPDVFVTNIDLPDEVAETAATTTGIRAKGNNLLLNRGGGEFREAAEGYGVLEGGWGWAAAFADLDNDMDEDLLHATRRMRFSYVTSTFSQERINRLYERTPQLRYTALFQRTDDGFERVPPQFAGLEINDGRGVAATDFDRDGRLDAAVSSLAGSYKLYENTVDTRRGSVEFDLRAGDGTTALGARVVVTAGNETQRRYRTSESDYLSQDSGVLHVGTGNNTRVDVRVVYPDGTEYRLQNLATGKRYVLDPGGVVRSVEYA